MKSLNVIIAILLSQLTTSLAGEPFTDPVPGKSIKANTYISGTFQNIKDGDSVILFLFSPKQVDIGNLNTPVEILKEPISENKDFLFSIRLDSIPRYIGLKLSSEKKYILYRFIMMPTDSVDIKRSALGEISFSGKTRRSFYFQDSVKKLMSRLAYESEPDTTEENKIWKIQKSEILKSNRILKQSLALLDKYKNGFTTPLLKLLEADLYGYSQALSLNLTIFYFGDSSFKSKFADSVLLYENKYLKYLSNDNRYSYLSYDYLSYLLKRIEVETAYSKKDRNQIQHTILSYNNNKLRERMLVMDLFARSTMIKNIDSVSQVASGYIADPFYKKIVANVRKLYAIDAKAPDFALENVHGAIVKLSDFQKKVVLVDYWFTGCNPCRKYYKNVLSVLEKEFSGNNKVVFITICIDGNKDIWMKSIASGAYTSSEAINLYTNGQGYKHPVITDYAVAAYPKPCLIGKDGRIKSVNSSELGADSQYDIESLRRKIAIELQAP